VLFSLMWSPVPVVDEPLALLTPPSALQAPTTVADRSAYVQPLLGAGGALVAIGGVLMAQAAVSAQVIDGRITEDTGMDSAGYAEQASAWEGARLRWGVGAGLAVAGAGAAGTGLILRASEVK